MLFQVALMRFHGKALDQHQIRSAEAVRANIIISHQNVTVLGRYSEVASAQGGRVATMRCCQRCMTAGCRTWARMGLSCQGCNSKAQSGSLKLGGVSRHERERVCLSA
jgi:hypothetical protein